MTRIGGLITGIFNLEENHIPLQPLQFSDDGNHSESLAVVCDVLVAFIWQLWSPSSPNAPPDQLCAPASHFSLLIFINTLTLVTCSAVSWEMLEISESKSHCKFRRVVSISLSASSMVKWGEIFNSWERKYPNILSAEKWSSLLLCCGSCYWLDDSRRANRNNISRYLWFNCPILFAESVHFLCFTKMTL